MDDPVELDRCLAETRAWVDRAVIGLNLCPFAKGVQIKGQVRYVASTATDEEALLRDLDAEIDRMVQTDPEQLDTTLLVHPHALKDFLDFNDFQARVDQWVADRDLEGVLQVASFHPDFQFAGTEPDDITNATNRAPYPTLHLLREDSIDRAVASFPEPDAIFEANMRTMEKLGTAGWQALKAQCRADAMAGGVAPADPKAAGADPQG